jgi:hypothetical protein
MKIDVKKECVLLQVLLHHGISSLFAGINLFLFMNDP